MSTLLLILLVLLHASFCQCAITCPLLSAGNISALCALGGTGTPVWTLGKCQLACDLTSQVYDPLGSELCPGLTPFCCGSILNASGQRPSLLSASFLCTNISHNSMSAVLKIYSERKQSPVQWFSLFACCKSLQLLSVVNIPPLFVIAIKTVTSTLTTLAIATLTHIFINAVYY